MLLAAALFVFAAAGRARADSVYFVGTTNGEGHTFGTVDSAGNTTILGTGLSFGGACAEKLMFAPNGTLYGFDVDYGGGSGAWGSINPLTGAFHQIGDLNTYFPDGLDHNENYGFSLAFGPSGTLYATGYDGSSNLFDYGTLNLTTGAFTEISASPVQYEGSLAAWGNNVYSVGTTDGEGHTFGTVDSAGNTTILGTGLSFGGAGAEKLMFAPNGTLYGFDVDYGGGSGAWGSINPLTGAFHQIGNLNTYFPDGLDHNENYGFSLALGPSGTLYATGYDGSSNLFDYGTLNLTTGAFTAIAASPVQYEGSLAAPTPEPGTLALLAVGAIGLVAYVWRRGSKKHSTNVRCPVTIPLELGGHASPGRRYGPRE